MTTTQSSRSSSSRSKREKRRRRTGVAHPAERDYGGPPRVDVFSSKLLDQEVNRRTAEAYQRLDDLVTHV